MALCGPEMKVKAIIDIQQGYLSRGGRIRSKTYRPCNGRRPDDDIVELIFTYKHKLANQPGQLEIECAMSQEDFDLAWSEADHKITKTRYILSCSERGVWEVDLFHGNGKIYLAMAEFEVPADVGPPDVCHPLVAEYLRYAVPEEDDRFSNRKLSDPKKVAKLLKEIA